MPIYEESYHGWQGRLRAAPRAWWVIARTGIRLSWRKGMILVLILSAIPFMVRAVQIYLVTRFAENTKVLEAVKGLSVNPEFFFRFMTGQHFFLILVMIVAGAGAIAGDRHLNALPLYFSKPLGFTDYVAGKWLVIAAFGSLVSWIPGCLLFLIRVLLSKDASFAASFFWVPASMAGFALLELCVMGVMMLAISSLTRSSRFAAVFFFLFLAFPEILRQILSKIPSVALLSLDANLSQAGAFLFGLPEPLAYPLWQAALVLALFFAACAAVLRLKVRPTEVVK